MNIFNSKEAQNAEWQASLALLSDEALILKVNNEVGNRGWTSSRAEYLNCLQKELRQRPFTSDILFDFDASGKIIAFKLSKRVQLLNDALIYS